MIDEKRLAELQGEKMLIHTMDACEIYDTLDSLLKIARAGEAIVAELSKAQGKVLSYAHVPDIIEKIIKLREALSALPPVEDKEPVK